MKKRYILFNTIVTLIALILMFLLGITVTKNNNIAKAEDDIVKITNIYVANYQKDFDYNQSIDDEIRVTIIDATGKVLEDSMQDATQMENHINREEIVNALKDSPKTCIRKSESTQVDMMYYAKKVEVDDGYIFLRVSIPIRSVNNYVSKTIVPMLFILLASLMVSLVISYFFAINMMNPLNKIKENLASITSGQKTKNLPTTSDEDINKILNEINDVGDKIDSNIQELKENKLRLDFILNNIPSGIVTFDQNEKIEIMNDSALKIFRLTNLENRTISHLSFEDELLKKIRSIYQDSNSKQFECLINGGIYYCDVSRLNEETYVLVLNNITEQRNNETIRSEFFANASHELKTPLTSIKGFNEVIMMKNKDHDLDKYLENINTETNRVLVLIEDMLKLSKLETKTNLETNEIDMRKLAEDISKQLQPEIDKNKIQLTIEGNLVLVGEKEHFYELLKNLMENAIKYNYENGEVKVSFNDNENEKIILVKDNGIGIDACNQERIFERFYRVSKSRSRNTGGTGLGLAIVKHIVQLYQGKIEVISSLGSGTTMKVCFPTK